MAASFIYHTCKSCDASSRLSTVNATLMVYSLILGLWHESVDCNSHVPSLAVEFLEAVDKFSSYMDQHRAIHVQHLMLVITCTASITNVSAFNWHHWAMLTCFFIITLSHTNAENQLRCCYNRRKLSKTLKFQHVTPDHTLNKTGYCKKQTKDFPAKDH